MALSSTPKPVSEMTDDEAIEHMITELSLIPDGDKPTISGSSDFQTVNEMIDHLERKTPAGMELLRLHRAVHERVSKAEADTPLLDVMAPLFENEEISDFIIERDLFVRPDITEWVQGADMLILSIGDETKKGRIQCFALKGNNLYVLYYDERKKEGERVSMDCLVNVNPEPDNRKSSGIRGWLSSGIRKILGK